MEEDVKKTYITWVRTFKVFVQQKEPSTFKDGGLQDFLSRLAVGKKFLLPRQTTHSMPWCSSTAMCMKEYEQRIGPIRARQRRHLSVILTGREIQNIFDHLSGTP